MNTASSQKLLPMLLLAIVTASGSTGITDANAADNTAIPVWPSPPAEPRIAFVRSFSRPEDLGIKKGFFRGLGELFTGADKLGLVRPMSVLEHNGVIFVGDPGARAIHRFDTRRQRHTIVQREKHQVLPSPVGLALGNDDKIYVADSVLGRIFILHANRKFAEPFALDSKLIQPTGIAVDRGTGNIYVTDTAAHHIKVFSETGKLLQTIGQRGSGEAAFNFPTMLWRTPRGEVLVTDSLNFRIQILGADGRFISSFGKLGNATGYLSRPKGVATDAAGNIYVIDSLFHAMQIFDPQGKLLLHIGKQGNGAGEFWLPTGIFIGDNQNIYVADSQNRRIQVFRPIRGRS